MNNPPRQRIASDEHLRGRDTIHRVFETGFSARRGRVIARFMFADARPTPLRFGVATARRIPNAVLRNRCKRLLREAIRKYKGECIATLCAQARAADVMFVWADPAVKLSTKLLPEISQSVQYLLHAIAAAATVTNDNPSYRAGSPV